MKDLTRFALKLTAIPLAVGIVFMCNYCYILSSVPNRDAEPSEYSNYEFVPVTIEQKQTVDTGNKININTADFDTLCLLYGVGKVTAQKIIDYRTQNGEFAKSSEIRAVKGFGDKKFLKIRDAITTGGLE